MQTPHMTYANSQYDDCAHERRISCGMHEHKSMTSWNSWRRHDLYSTVDHVQLGFRWNLCSFWNIICKDVACMHGVRQIPLCGCFFGGHGIHTLRKLLSKGKHLGNPLKVWPVGRRWGGGTKVPSTSFTFPHSIVGWFSCPSNCFWQICPNLPRNYLLLQF